MHVELLSTSLREGSASRRALELMARALDELGVTTRINDLRELPMALCDGRELDEYPPAYGALHARLVEADGVVIGFPVHLYSSSGPAKNLVDIVGGALEGRLVALVSAAGSLRSHLAVRDLMGALVMECEAFVHPATAQVTAEDVETAEVRERLHELARGFVRAASALRVLREPAEVAA